MTEDVYPPAAVELRDHALDAQRQNRWTDAEDLFQQAFEAGHPVAACDLGYSLLRRDDKDGAYEWFRRAAEQGVPSAAFEVGYGAEVRGDPEKAERWYRQAAEGGHQAGTLNLAVLLENRGQVPDAIDLFLSAWELGSDKAAFNLGRIYDDDGRGDLEKAAEWYGRAAGRGNAGAAYNLGHVRLDQRRPAAAVDAWERAAGLGHAKAPGALADILMKLGKPDQARFWREFLNGLSDYSPQFAAFASAGSAVAIHRQDVLNEALGEGMTDTNVEERTLTMGDRVYRDIVFLGTFSHVSQTWLWGWGNEHHSPDLPAIAPLRVIREYGQEHGIPELTAPCLDLSGFPNPYQAASTMVIAAAALLGGNGVRPVRIGDGKGTAYFHLDDPQLPVAGYDSLSAPRVLNTAVEVFPSDPRRVVRGFLAHHDCAITEGPDVIQGRFPDDRTLTVGFTDNGLLNAITVEHTPPGERPAEL
ncbi:hypothetical protein GCM10010191_50460 [Actinomadura vinacea]|uniref:Sel1 repeat family protein n=1 Tax=Actinomadura vinacea TaxID=115336 RepID=A0ABP5WMA0_9ACTN